MVVIFKCGASAPISAAQMLGEVSRLFALKKFVDCIMLYKIS